MCVDLTVTTVCYYNKTKFNADVRNGENSELAETISNLTAVWFSYSWNY